MRQPILQQLMSWVILRCCTREDPEKYCQTVVQNIGLDNLRVVIQNEDTHDIVKIHLSQVVQQCEGRGGLFTYIYLFIYKCLIMY